MSAFRSSWRIVFLSMLLGAAILGVGLFAISNSKNAPSAVSAPTCTYSQLEVAVAAGPGGNAGNVGIPFIIANTGRATCSLVGHPRLTIATEATNKATMKIGTNVSRGVYGPARTKLVLIKPNADASFGLDFVDALNQKDTNGPACTVGNVEVSLPVSKNVDSQKYDTTVNFNICYSGYSVSVTPIENGARPKT